MDRDTYTLSVSLVSLNPRQCVVLWTFGDSNSVVWFSSRTALKFLVLEGNWSHLQWMVSKVFNNWVLFPAGAGISFHTTVSRPTVGPIQRSVGRYRGKVRIYLLSYVTWVWTSVLPIRHSTLPPSGNICKLTDCCISCFRPGRRACFTPMWRRWTPIWTFIARFYTSLERLVYFLHRKVITQRNYRCHCRFTDHTSDLQIPRCIATNITLQFYR